MPKATKSKAKPPNSAEAQLSKFQTFTMERVHRRNLVVAKYNPRTITDEARGKLRANLQSVGLLAPLTLNRTTGTLLSGHQRLACLDALEGTDDYLLDVSVVELTEKQEKEQNVALNSDRLTGDWDLDLLADLLKTPDLDLSATGFSILDVQLTFDDPELGALFAPNAPTKALLDDLQSLQDDGRAPSKSKGAGSSGDSGDDSDGARDGKPSTREIMKQTRANNKENFADDDTETYALVAFESRAEREAFMTHCGASGDDRYIDGERVLAKMGEQIASAVRAARPKPPVIVQRDPKPAKPAKSKAAKKPAATN